MLNIEDKILLNEIRNRNRDVFKLLFKEYYPFLVRFAEGFLHDLPACEDLVQSFFVSFWTTPEKLNINTSIKNYFLKSIRNKCLNYLRDIKIRDQHQILYLESLINIESEEDLEDRQISTLITKTVEELPPQMREIFRLKYFEGKQINEIAKSLNVTEGTVKTQLFRARITLRDRLPKSIMSI